MDENVLVRITEKAALVFLVCININTIYAMPYLYDIDENGNCEKCEKINSFRMTGMMLGTLVGSAVSFKLIVPNYDFSVGENYISDLVNVNDELNRFLGDILLFSGLTIAGIVLGYKTTELIEGGGCNEAICSEYISSMNERRQRWQRDNLAVALLIPASFTAAGAVAGYKCFGTTEGGYSAAAGGITGLLGGLLLNELIYEISRPKPEILKINSEGDEEYVK
ncbi:MAG TPA: hypothetical protein PLB12_08990 [Candidatus Goldiibacteriota bacterium]|nr:hypothetical protein [Candidatus Goldiibacteriota bacterium]HPN63899.1 hypothetical protein [Candidatus Goldiibacteriota bacterium]HRQ44473.1 hypothetical protein [Candidatus Goldiibacteriota bacterium]